jgi:hypothetical protein
MTWKNDFCGIVNSILQHFDPRSRLWIKCQVNYSQLNAHMHASCSHHTTVLDRLVLQSEVYSYSLQCLEYTSVVASISVKEFFSKFGGLLSHRFFCPGSKFQDRD